MSKLHLTASGEIPEADISTGYPTSELSGPITNSQLAGSISNDKLAPASGTASISGSGTGQGSLFNVIKAASIGTTDIDSTLTADNVSGENN